MDRLLPHLPDEPTAGSFEDLPESEQDLARTATRLLQELAHGYLEPVSILDATGVKVLGSASACTVHIADTTYALTAAHVFLDPIKRLGKDNLRFMIGERPLVHPVVPAFIREREDVALFKLDAGLATSTGSRTYALDRSDVERSVPAPGSYLVMTGCPGHSRSTHGDVVEYEAHAATLRVTSSSESHMMCRFDRSSWISVKGPGPPPQGTSWGGMSGGPAFLVGQHHYPLVGVIGQFDDGFGDLELLRVESIRGLLDFAPFWSPA